MRGMPKSLARVPGRRARLVAVLAMMTLAFAALAGYRWYPTGRESTRFAASVPRLGHYTAALLPGVYLLGGLSPSAAYALETPEGIVLIDSGLDDDAGLLKAQMTELHLDWNRVRAILLTHAHGDHTAGAEALRTATGAKVYAGKGDTAVLRAGQPREAFFSTFYMPDHAPHPTTVDVALEGGETITLGDIRIQALAAPGHTPGSICYLLERNQRRLLFTGDVIMMLRGDEKPRIELRKPLGTYSAYLAPRYRGDVKDSLASLRRLPRCPCLICYCPAILPRTSSPKAPASLNSAGNLCSIRASATWRHLTPATGPTAPFSWTKFPSCSFPIFTIWEISKASRSMASFRRPGSSSSMRRGARASSNSCTRVSAS